MVIKWFFWTTLGNIFEKNCAATDNREVTEAAGGNIGGALTHFRFSDEELN